MPVTTHVFRHNSVSRAHRAGVSVAQNMRLHGHQTLLMHLRYLHLLLEDTTNEMRQIFAEKCLRDVRQLLGTTAGKIVEGGIAYTVSLEQYLGITLQRALKRRTYGIWGGFWAGALAQRGIASPLSVEEEIVIPEDTYEHTVAQGSDTTQKDYSCPATSSGLFRRTAFPLYLRRLLDTRSFPITDLTPLPWHRGDLTTASDLLSLFLRTGCFLAIDTGEILINCLMISSCLHGIVNAIRNGFLS